MTAASTQHRCLHHPTREAVARCPECREFYCRECITEHDDRVICSACLKKLAGQVATPRRSWSALLRPAAVLGGMFTAWIFFYAIGHWATQIPSSFHSGELWGAAFESPD